MQKIVLIDTGPLVSLINSREKTHAIIQETISNLSPPFLTCEAVITETCFLLQRFYEGEDKVIKLLDSGNVIINFQLQAELSRVRELMRRYSNVPMSLADACLVRMNEVIPGSAILTLDSDFHIYRKNQSDSIDLINL